MLQVSFSRGSSRIFDRTRNREVSEIRARDSAQDANEPAIYIQLTNNNSPRLIKQTKEVASETSERRSAEFQQQQQHGNYLVGDHQVAGFIPR